MVNISTFNNADTFRQELQPSERILWMGKPKQEFRLFFRDWISFVGVGFWVFIVLSSFSKGGQSSIWTILPFLLVIVGFFALIICVNVLIERYARFKTDYAVTNERALISRGILIKTVDSVILRDTPEVLIEEKSDGYGTILFGRPSGLQELLALFSRRHDDRYGVPVFEQIENVREVYELIQHAKSGLN